MSQPERYSDISREARITDSDKAAIRELETKLRTKLQVPEKGDIIESLIKEWVRKYHVKIKAVPKKTKK
jgi:hypothetical protein